MYLIYTNKNVRGCARVVRLCECVSVWWGDGIFLYHTPLLPHNTLQFVRFCFAPAIRNNFIEWTAKETAQKAMYLPDVVSVLVRVCVCIALCVYRAWKYINCQVQKKNF